MDFQKEKEAFESVFTEAKGWDLTFIMGCYQNIETLRAFAGWLAAKAQAVPEGFVLVKKVHPDAIVHNQGLGLFKECQVIYGWDSKSKDFKDALNKGFYHGVKLGAKAVLESQEPAND